MKILLHIDPYNCESDMVLNRCKVYSQLYKEFSGNDFEVFLYASSKIDFSKFDIPSNHIISADWMNFDVCSYDGLAYSNNLPKLMVENAIEKYREINFTPDLIITNTSSSLIRKVWMSSLILHYELGFFNREPFPVFHQFDPLGYYGNSILSKYPVIGGEASRLEIDYLSMMKNKILSSIQLKNTDVGCVDAVYVPLPSTSWAVNVEINYPSRVDYLVDYAKRHPNKLILTNEKPQSRLLDFEKDALLDVKNIELIENQNHLGDGSQLAMYCKHTHTFSPSLGLQTLFWGNRLTAPVQSSLSGWANLPNSSTKFSAYINRFHLSELSKIINMIPYWNNCNPYTRSF